jgi:cobalt-zinc-cadmium efflux system membrane fusion protein
MKRWSVFWMLTAFLAGCGGEEEKPAAAAADPTVVTASAELLQRLKVGPAGEAEIGDVLRVPAQVEVDGTRYARVGAPVTGRVTEIAAMPGKQVKAGDELASLHSAELSAAQLAYLKAASQQDLQRRAVERAKLLYGADVIGLAELQKREAELSQARAEFQAAHDQLKALGMPPAAVAKLARNGNIRSLSTVTATLDGTVIERRVTQGQVVQPADVLFTIADLGHVWITAEVPEQQAEMVKQGEAALAEIPALPGRKIEGKLIYVADTVDPKSRTVTVRMDVENPDRSIKPEMLATMLIRGKTEKRLAVPAQAVVREENKSYVFVQLDGQRFKLRAVELGSEVDGRVPVLKGLQAGEKIVADGAFHLNNERKRKELEGS